MFFPLLLSEMACSLVPENTSIDPVAVDHNPNPAFLRRLTATLSLSADTAPFHNVVYRNLFNEADFCSEDSSIDVDNAEDVDDDAVEEDIGVGRISVAFKGAPRTALDWRVFSTGIISTPWLPPVAPPLKDRIFGKLGVSTTG